VALQAPSRQVIVAEGVHTPLGYRRLRSSGSVRRTELRKNTSLWGFVEHIAAPFPGCDYVSGEVCLGQILGKPSETQANPCLDEAAPPVRTLSTTARGGSREAGGGAAVSLHITLWHDQEGVCVLLDFDADALNACFNSSILRLR